MQGQALRPGLQQSETPQGSAAPKTGFLNRGAEPGRKPFTGTSAPKARFLTEGRGEPGREPFTESSAPKTRLLAGYLLVAKGTTKTSRKSLFAGPQFDVAKTGA